MQRPGRRRSVSNPSQLWSEEQLLADVEGGPQGPRVGALRDFDGTLINGYSLSAFARHYLRSGRVAPADLGQLLLTGLRGVTTEEDFERLTVLSMRVWAGRSEDELSELGERLFVQAISGSLYPEGWRLVAAHRRAGHTVVLASSATRFQVDPAARCCGGRARRRRCARSPGSMTSIWPRATPTPTATRTCRSCRRPGGRGP